MIRIFCLDVDYVKKQMVEYETNTQDLKSQISLLRNQLESKDTESAILKVNLDDSSEELENIRLQLQQTQQSNPTKVPSKRGNVVFVTSGVLTYFACSRYADCEHFVYQEVYRCIL